MRNTAVLLIDCPDRKGLVAGVANLLYRYGANITHADQHQDPEAELFFMRVEWELAGFDLASFRGEFETLAAGFQMRWRLNLMSQPPRVAIFVSQYLHCLADLLHRHQTGELGCTIPMIVSNHAAGEALARFHEIEFHHIPVNPGDRCAAEEAQLRLLADSRADLVVLARYMRVLSPAYCAELGSRTINIHHSFLPAFRGANAYRQAWERGVKLIGATAHYVTADLDEGPIIAQDVARVAHGDGPDTMARRGRDLEALVLATAVRAHLEHRVIAYAGRTVVFD